MGVLLSEGIGEPIRISLSRACVGTRRWRDLASSSRRRSARSWTTTSRRNARSTQPGPSRSETESYRFFPASRTGSAGQFRITSIELAVEVLRVRIRTKRWPSKDAWKGSEPRPEKSPHGVSAADTPCDDAT